MPFPSEHSPITVIHIGVKLQPGVKFHTDPNQGQVPGQPLNQAARDTAINAPLRISRSGCLNTMGALKAALCSAEQGQALPATGSGTPAGLRLGDVLRALPCLLLSPSQAPPSTHTHFLLYSKSSPLPFPRTLRSFYMSMSSLRSASCSSWDISPHLQTWPCPQSWENLP